MTIVFDSCDTGVVTYETDHAEVGSGSFDIVRVSEVMNTHCSGGISDDMHADAMFGEQRMELTTAREGISGSGLARYDDYPGHMGYEVEVEGLPDGDYHNYVDMLDRGVFTVTDGHGHLAFSSPGETGKMMMTAITMAMVMMNTTLTANSVPDQVTEWVAEWATACVTVSMMGNLMRLKQILSIPVCL